MHENIIPWTISAISLLILILNFFKADTEKAETTTKEQKDNYRSLSEALIKANMKLDELCRVTSETSNNVKQLNKDIVNIDKRVTMVERDLKVAFTEIDNIKHNYQEEL